MSGLGHFRPLWSFQALVDLAQVPTTEPEPHVRKLIAHCSALPEVIGTAVALAPSQRQRAAIVASDEAVRARVVRDVRAGDGPIRECIATQRPAAGSEGLHVLPMQVPSHVLGALCLFVSFDGEGPAKLDQGVLELAQAMADVTSLSLESARTVRTERERIEQLNHALDSRVVIEQAKGVLSERLGVGVDAAFESLRDRARSERKDIHRAASEVIDSDGPQSGGQPG